MTATVPSPGVGPLLETRAVLELLTPAAERGLARHLRMAREWMPHEYVPWSLGRDFDTEPYEPGQSRLTDVAQVGFEVNLLTEDNLPSYHYEIATVFGRDSVWGTWVHRWTAEEGRHAQAMRDYLLVTRGVDPVELERGRMVQMETGFDSGAKTPLRAIAYVSFQELATRISHRNLGRVTGDPVAERLMTRIATDENLHMVFYRDLMAEAIAEVPSESVLAIAAEVADFQMPGSGIPHFETKARQLAAAGIYDLRIHHDEVVMPILRAWDFWGLTGLSDAAEEAREQTRVHLSRLDRLATIMRRRSETAQQAS